VNDIGTQLQETMVVSKSVLFEEWIDLIDSFRFITVSLSFIGAGFPVISDVFGFFQCFRVFLLFDFHS
jgi:hypothetical protein